jgi:hypothetical protein
MLCDKINAEALREFRLREYGPWNFKIDMDVA